MVYLPTRTIKINHMQVNTPYMDGMGFVFVHLYGGLGIGILRRKLTVFVLKIGRVSKGKGSSRWWFQMFSIFTPIWASDPI